MHKVRFYFFTVVMVIYLGYPALMIYQQEQILWRGTAYRLKLEPVDPYDAFRGRYLSLRFNSPSLAAPAGLTDDQKIYVTISSDSLGYARFERILTARPGRGDYIQTTATYVDQGKAQFIVPESLNYYFLNEKTAPLAEAAYQELVGSQPADSSGIRPIRAFARVRVLNGSVRIQELYFDGKPLREYLEIKSKSKK